MHSCISTDLPGGVIIRSCYYYSSRVDSTLLGGSRNSNLPVFALSLDSYVVNSYRCNTVSMHIITNMNFESKIMYCTSVHKKMLDGIIFLIICLQLLSESEV